ncbi:MAG: rSAM/selenodomain-associated transferase 1 [Verrucomicrobiales bacterium]
MSRVVIVMAKRPRPGNSKTRLIPSLGAQGAAALASSMLGDTVEMLTRRSDCTVAIGFDPPDARAWFDKTFPGVALIEQRAGSFGERLDGVLSDALESGFDSVFAIGADSPDLPPSHLDDAFGLLGEARHDIVFGPTNDGGYYLIGWKSSWTRVVTDVTMSTPTVLNDSLEIARSLGASVALAPEWFDVDEAADLARLRSSLGPKIQTKTAQILADIDASPQTVVVIPALDEAENIAGVVTSLLVHPGVRVVVVDNGSIDDTAAMAVAAGATVVTERRTGYGFACAAGSVAAIGMGADIVAFIDGDGSSRADELPTLLAPIIDGDAELVLGSRTRGNIEGGAMPTHQRAGNRVISAMMRRLYKVDVTDLGPYRAIDASLLDDLDMKEMTFGWPTEMMVKAAVRKRAIAEVPVSWDRRAGGESKIGGTMKGSVLAGLDIIRVTLRHALRFR